MGDSLVLDRKQNTHGRDAHVLNAHGREPHATGEGIMARKPRALTRDEFMASAQQRCGNPRQLHDWVELHTGLNVPTKAVCPHHDAPFEYLKAGYFEPAQD